MENHHRNSGFSHETWVDLSSSLRKRLPGRVIQENLCAKLSKCLLPWPCQARDPGLRCQEILESGRPGSRSLGFTEGLGKWRGQQNPTSLFSVSQLEDSTFGHMFWEPPFYVLRRLPIAIHYPGHSRKTCSEVSSCQVGQDFDFENRPVSASELFWYVQLTVYSVMMMMMMMFWPIFKVLWKLPIPSRLGFSSLRVLYSESMKPPEKVAGKSIQPLITQVIPSHRGLIPVDWSVFMVPWYPLMALLHSSCLMTHNYNIIPLWWPFRAGKREKKEFETIN